MDMQSRSLVLAAFTALALAVAPACGGSTNSDLFGGSPTDGGGQGGHGGEGGEAAEDAAPKESGARDGAPGDAVQPSADPGISCGSAECQVSTEECCRTAEPGGATSFRCQPRGACVLNNQLAIPCDDAADCATLGVSGAVCCAIAVQGAVYQVVCKPPSECPFNANNYILCDPNAPNPCPNGGTCAASATPTIPYDYCKH
jgi:hypothetical protein